MLSNLNQGSPEWLLFRKYHIGSSDISAIMGHNRWKDAYTLWEGKVGEELTSFMSEAMIHGKETEAEAREALIADTGLLFLPSVKVSTEWEVAMASLDGETQDEKTICEIKCPTNENLYLDALGGIIPPMYMDQMQWALWVTKADKCLYFVYLDSFRYKMVPVLPDVKYQEKMVAEAKIFWDYVTSKTPPPRDHGTVITEEFANEIAKELADWKRAEKEAQIKVDYLESQLKSMFFEDKKYLFPEGGIKMAWSERKGNIDWKAYQRDYDITDAEIEKYRKKSVKYSTFNLVD